MPARTLYELLGVRPDDDAKTLHNAFRDAAKAHHPDQNPGDPDATRRFTQIVNAYGILRNAEQRGVYDEMLALERARRRTRLTRTFVSHAVAIVALSAIMIGGYTLFGYVSKTSIEAAKVVEAVARRPAEIEVVEPGVPKDRSPRGEPGGKSTGVELADASIVPSAAAPDDKSHEPLIMAQGDSTPDPAGSNSEVDKAVDALVAAVDRGDMGSVAAKKNSEVAKAVDALMAAVDRGDMGSITVKKNSEVAEAVDALIAAVARGDMGSDTVKKNSELAKAVDALVAAVDRGDMGSITVKKNSEVAEAVDALIAAVARGDMGSGTVKKNSELAKAVDALIAAVDRGDMGRGADHQKRNDESHSLDQTRIGSVEPRSSSSEKDKTPSSDLAILDEKHDVRTNAKPRAQAKRAATGRTFVRQAAVESRDLSQVAHESRSTSSCAGSCSDRAPPLFGVGF